MKKFYIKYIFHKIGITVIVKSFYSNVYQALYGKK